MKNSSFFKVYYIIFFLILSGCIVTNEDTFKAQTVNNTDFRQYWFKNEAELTRYELQQSRYGQLREGNAVLIFVTEDFFISKQVKYEKGDYKDATPVLKLNFERDFNTGIYPYHTMTSVFTPLFSTGQKTLKVVSTFQEWCGVVYRQINLKGNQYRIQLFSYFQNEGDKTLYLEKTLLEDELWTKIRIHPGSVPSGKVQIIPGTTFSRFTHLPLNIESAQITINEISDTRFSDNVLKRLSLEYTTIERKLIIYYDREFPYAIAGWEETYPGGVENDIKNLTTTAVRTHSIKLDYWNYNKLDDMTLRKSLGLE